MAPKSDKTRFRESLSGLSDDARREMNALDREAVDEGIDPTIDTDLFDIEFSNGSEYLEEIEIDTFGEALVTKLRLESERIFDGANLQTLREEEALLKVTKGAMTKALERISIITQSFEGSDISNEVEAIEFWQRAAGVIQSMDERALMEASALDAGAAGDVVLDFYDVIGEQIPEDYTAVVERILADDLDQVDREFISEQIRSLATRDLSNIFSESTKIIQGSQVGLLLTNLNENPKEKAKVIEMTLEGPGGPEAILNLTMGGHLTVVEAEYLLEGAMQTETDPVRLEAMQEVRTFILGETMNEVAEERTVIQREVAERMPYTIGHKNQALAKLSYRGIVGTYIKLIAATGLVMNVLANVKHPVRGILLNPMIAASLAVGSVGAAVDPSDIGLWPKPGTHLSKLARDKNEWEEADVEAAFSSFKKDMLNHPIEAELYHEVSDRIVDEAQAQISDGAAVGQVDITMDALGMDYDKLPDRYKSIPKEKMEARFTDWVQTFMYDDGLNLDSAAQQSRYMNEARDEHPLLNGDWVAEGIDNALD